MNTIQDLIRETRVLDLGPLPAPRLTAGATLRQAVQMLVRGRRGAVVVIEKSHPVGIFTERDVVVRKVDGLFAPSDAGTRARLRDAMSHPPVTVSRQTTLREALEAMVAGNHRHLVVVDRNGALRGLLTTGDIVQYVTDQFPEDTVNLPPRLRQHYQNPEGA